MNFFKGVSQGYLRTNPNIASAGKIFGKLVLSKIKLLNRKINFKIMTVILDTSLI